MLYIINFVIPIKHDTQQLRHKTFNQSIRKKTQTKVLKTLQSDKHPLVHVSLLGTTKRNTILHHFQI